MKTAILTAESANEIQREWMKLESDALPAEKRRVFALMERLPSSYIAQNASEMGTVMVDGMPSHAFPEPIEKAIQRAESMGVQTALRWHASGKWIDQF